MLQDTFRMTLRSNSRTEYCLQRSQRSKVIKEDTLLLIQIDGQTNWTKEESDLNGSRIGEYSGTVKKGLPHGQGQLCYLHGGKYLFRGW